MSDDDRYYNDLAASSSLSLPGLFNDFALPARLLRLAKERNDLPPVNAVFDDSCAGDAIIHNFYKLLDKVEGALSDPSSQQKLNISQQTKFIIEVEGLDGSGKTTLVKRLQDALSSPQRAAIATKTPTASLHDIRPLWDKRGGILARAFYMISNYILEYEIANNNDLYDKKDIIIIDRWYASTCAYTVARPPADDNSANGNELKEQQQQQQHCISISDMPNELFDWPKDLRLRPNILLVLKIDQDERQKRVDNRARRSTTTTGEGEEEEEVGESRFNPWDKRLAKDKALGERILQALQRILGPVETHSINANKSIEDVMKQALDVVTQPMERHLNPQVYFAPNPLQWWAHMAQKLNCCDEHGKRIHHALWNLQVSYINNNTNNNGEYCGPSVPVLKTVGLDRIDANFVYYWTASTAFPTTNDSNTPLWASILWEGQTYPTEFQWRAEGYLRRVTDEECTLRGYRAPSSLVAHVSACMKLSSNGGNSSKMRRISRPDSYDGAVYDARNDDDVDHSVCMVRFVPIRIEVLRGGPSTRLPGYPQRWEWSRRNLDATDNGAADTSSWTMRSILPFGPSPSCQIGFRDLTICIVGTHTSGKSTIGRKLAKLLGCQFDGELGETERDSESLVEGGHLHGDGSSSATTTSSGQDDWDDFLHGKECKRDNLFHDSKSSMRVVETWHVGNAAWYNLRQQQESSTDFERYKIAIAKHQESSLVLVIQLMLASPSTMVKRRRLDTDNCKRLPMQEEEKECNQLFGALQDNNLKDAMLDPLGVPFLQIDNSVDGSEAMEKILTDILSFSLKHLHRQVLVD